MIDTRMWDKSEGGEIKRLCRSMKCWLPLEASEIVRRDRTISTAWLPLFQQICGCSQVLDQKRTVNAWHDAVLNLGRPSISECTQNGFRG